MPAPSTSRIWAQLEAYPPIKVRLLAHTDHHSYPAWIPDAELAILSGLTLDRVQALSRMEDWDDVTFGEFKTFCAACRFDPTVAYDRNRVNQSEYKCLKTNSRPFQWLTRSPAYETEVKPLLRRLARLEQARSPVRHVA